VSYPSSTRRHHRIVQSSPLSALGSPAIRHLARPSNILVHHHHPPSPPTLSLPLPLSQKRKRKKET
jgi:hypothetical protein